MSASAASLSTCARAVASLKSTTTLCLLRLSPAKLALIPANEGAPKARIQSPSGGSILVTSAPRSARCVVARGPASPWVKSRTLIPANGPPEPHFVISDFLSYWFGCAVLHNLFRMLAMIGRETFRPRRLPAEPPWNRREQYPSRFRMCELSHEAGLEQKSILKRINERAKHACTRHYRRLEICDAMRSRGGTQGC